VKGLSTTRRLTVLLALAGLYFSAGKLGLELAVVHASISAVWPATGVALAAFLILGYDAWPGILLGSFLVNLTTAGSAAVCLGIAIGDTLEGLAGTYLVNKFARGRNAFQRTQDIFKFVFFAAILSSAIAATIGMTSLSIGRSAPWANYWTMWFTWWQGDAVGAIVVTPVLLLWTGERRMKWDTNQIVEACAVLVLLLAIGLTIFDGIFSTQAGYAPIEFLCIPVLIWAALRFGPREAAIATTILAGIAIWGTMRGNGPFVMQNKNASLLLLQAFMGVTVIVTLVLAAEVRQRKDSLEKIRLMALSDPLTGLANYRRLVEALEGEMRRYGRTERPFAILVLDLDGLKIINDTYGHVVGSQALRRVAEILRAHCRATDLPARYGGDEFVVVLPESERAAAEQVARRISDHVAKSSERPPISVSIGVAVYPVNGISITELVAAADRELYAKKAEKNSKTPRTADSVNYIL